MAVGGYGHATAEVLHLDETDPSFAKAPELQLPIELRGMASFTVQNEIFLTGGVSSEGPQSKIYKITCQNEDLKLVTLATSLKHPKSEHVSLPVPESLFH